MSADSRRYYREWLLMAILSLSTLGLFTHMQWGQTPGMVIYDQFVRHWPALPGKDIVVIAVDDRTIESQGGWPIRRSLYAQLLQKLADTGNRPRSIGFDILFADSRPEDMALAEQMRRHRVYLAAQLGSAQSLARHIPQVSHVLVGSAAGLAHVNLSFEADGSLRGARLLLDDVPHLALAVSGLDFSAAQPAESYRRMHLVHPAVGFPSSSLADVLSGAVPLDLFKDKFVLIGSTAPSLGDHYPTIHAGEHSAGTPGVLLHANLLSNLLHDELIEPVSSWVQLTLACLSLGLALLALLVLSPMAELLASMLIATSTLLLSLALLVMTHRWFDPSLSLMALALIKPAWTWRRSEMIVRFMDERVKRLGLERRRKTLREGLRLRHFTSDTLMQYSQVLDKAIDRANDRLSFLQRLVAEVPMALLVSDAQGRILLVNPAMSQSLPEAGLEAGASLESLLARLGLHTSEFPKLMGMDHMVQISDAHGQVREFIMRLASIVQGEDEPLWVLSMAEVTEMRQFQTQRDQTLQLLSHDMRTPIAAILALSRSSDAGLRDVNRSRDIHRHANTLLHMMDDFIFSIHAQAPRYRLVELLFENLLDEAVYQVRDLAHANQMTIRVEQGDEPLFVMADARLMVRVLVNLLMNAVRYGHPGTDIVLRVDSDPSAAVRPTLVCSVLNTVAGRAHPELSDTGRSFGLGLEFVRTVMQKHEGQVHAFFPDQAGQTARVDLTLFLAH